MAPNAGRALRWLLEVKVTGGLWVDDQRAVGDLFFEYTQLLGDDIELVHHGEQRLLVLDREDVRLRIQLDRCRVMCGHAKGFLKMPACGPSELLIVVALMLPG